MNQPSVRVLDRVVYSGSRRFDFEYPVQEAWWRGDLLIVFLDPDGRREKIGTFPNLLAVDNAGRRVWEAELPTTTTGDRYYRVASRDPIVLYSFSSFDCEIDPNTGRILRRTFTK